MLPGFYQLKEKNVQYLCSGCSIFFKQNRFFKMESAFLGPQGTFDLLNKNKEKRLKYCFT